MHPETSIDHVGAGSRHGVTARSILRILTPATRYREQNLALGLLSPDVPSTYDSYSESPGMENNITKEKVIVIVGSCNLELEPFIVHTL